MHLPKFDACPIHSALRASCIGRIKIQCACIGFVLFHSKKLMCIPSIHVLLITGGLDKAVIGATEIGAKAFALFLRSQRQWQAKPLEDKVMETFIFTG